MKRVIFFATFVLGLMWGFTASAQGLSEKERFGGSNLQIHVYDNASARVEFECGTAAVQASHTFYAVDKNNLE